MSKDASLDPYRVYFPLGALASVLGVFPWIVYGFGITEFYPGVLHPDLMIGGFLYAFVAGFLMTAIPQFTGSSKCRRGELAFAVLLFMIVIVASLFGLRPWSYLFSFLALCYLVYFCMQRFSKRNHEPPPFFVFVGLGLFMGTSGVFMLALVEFNLMSREIYYPLAKLFYTQGMPLSLILGVGTRLLPALWGWAELPTHAVKVSRAPHSFKVIIPVLVLAFVLLASFFMEVFLNAQIAWVVRASLASYLAVTRWTIFKKPKAKGKIAFWLWVSAWTLLLGLWGPVFRPDYWLHLIHITFIGGFALMALMIASRVILAHGGHGFYIDYSSRMFTLVAILVLLTALTRAIAPLIQGGYLRHLAYAACLWCTAIALWLRIYLPKIMSSKQSSM